MITVLVDDSDWRSVQLADLHNIRQGGGHGQTLDGAQWIGTLRDLCRSPVISGSRKAHKSTLRNGVTVGPDPQEVVPQC